MFIDIHAHTTIYPREIRPLAPGKGIGTPDELVEIYDRVGIDRGCILPATQPEPRSAVQSNEDILQCAAKYPDRLIPFCGIDPRLLRNSPDVDLSYVINHYKEKGCRGIGEITANIPFDDPRVWNLFEHAEKCEMPLTFHIGPQEGNCYGLVDERGLPRLEKSLAEFPELVFLAHSQPFWSHISGDVGEDNWSRYPEGPVVEGGRIPELLRKYPNLHGDLSAGSGYNAISRDPEFAVSFLNEFADQLLFGTDAYKMDQINGLAVQMKHLLEDALSNGDISQEVFDKITHENAIRVLKLDE
ncbi:MAG: amidohydrolase family protein [Armatimonadota bacterium]